MHTKHQKRLVQILELGANHVIFLARPSRASTSLSVTIPKMWTTLTKTTTQDIIKVTVEISALVKNECRIIEQKP